MEIKEYFLEGKINNIKNEDGIFIGKNIIAVIDGVTSKTDNLYNGFKSGKVILKKISLELAPSILAAS